LTSDFEKRLEEETLSSVIRRYFSQTLFPDHMDSARLAEFQKEALREAVTRAYENSPFYRQKMTEAGVKPQDINNLSDLAKMPFTTKDELRRDPWALLACEKKDISVIHVSTGTTGGQPIYTMQTWKEYYLNTSINYPRLQPIEQDDLCFVALPYEMSAAGLDFHTRFLAGYQAAVMAVGKGGAYSTPEKTVKLIRDLKPTIIVTSPSYAITLAEAAAEASFDLPGLRLKKIWLAGEGCSPAFRQRIEKIWGTTVNFACGATECGTIGIECDAHDGYHISQGHILVEIVDPKTGKVPAPGEIGEIVVTCLLRFDTPLIRYRTQDLGCLDAKPCPCGVTLERLHLRGRLVDQIVLKGTAYSPVYLENFLMQLPEVGNWYQFVVKPDDNEKLKIRAELAPGLKHAPELAKKLAAKMETAIGVPCEFELVSRLPRPVQKAIRVVYA
jgi:phenylacetate-CoA ligase